MLDNLVSISILSKSHRIADIALAFGAAVKLTVRKNGEATS